ncbi:hypothetical protein [Kaistella yonginensis]|nr:hypothetical protein [Kaistella yonginensis]MDN3606089.1 hypothetical protein [Kaistella yonginensis]
MKLFNKTPITFLILTVLGILFTFWANYIIVQPTKDYESDYLLRFYNIQ